MRQLFEVFSSSGGDWLKSSLVMQHREIRVASAVGTFVWRTFESLVTEYRFSTSIYIYIAILAMALYILGSGTGETS